MILHEDNNLRNSWKKGITVKTYTERIKMVDVKIEGVVFKTPIES